VVRVGAELTRDEVGKAEVHDSGFKYSQAAPESFVPFDTDAYYERKAYHVMKQWEDRVSPRGTILFWSVTGSGTEDWCEAL
jgi:hypothetical protein